MIWDYGVLVQVQTNPTITLALNPITRDKPALVSRVQIHIKDIFHLLQKDKKCSALRKG